MTRTDDFSENGFVSLLLAFRDSGYVFTTFDEFAPQNCVILRHDIDFSIHDAARMAALEHELGISATYFVLLSSAFYNPLSPDTKTSIAGMLRSGARLGLHFDPTAHADMEAGFEAERRTFEEAFDCSLDIVSLHRPRGFLDDNNRKLPVRHTYEDEFFKDIKYISDSGGRFAYGHPLDSAEFGKRTTIHLNLHPIWWMRDGSTPSDKLRSWQKDLFGFVNEEIGRNCRTYDGRGIFNP